MPTWTRFDEFLKQNPLGMGSICGASEPGGQGVHRPQAAVSAFSRPPLSDQVAAVEAVLDSRGLLEHKILEFDTSAHAALRDAFAAQLRLPPNTDLSAALSNLHEHPDGASCRSLLKDGKLSDKAAEKALRVAHEDFVCKFVAPHLAQCWRSRGGGARGRQPLARRAGETAGPGRIREHGRGGADGGLVPGVPLNTLRPPRGQGSGEEA
mmetsp:Transcript_13862/g.33406  ORF Transcript_13862/g.33406 Transcript_13862/m.33406 type:complete len:209 (+) Transcript_13862:345-971(+)